MSIIRDVCRELLDMFFADARLATAILFLVAGVAGLMTALQIAPLFGGGILFLGCLALLVEAARHDAKAGSHQ
jgi:hypothetical protein